MMSSRILREAENASATHSFNKPVPSEQKLSKMKAKALGDVQNTLHSRSVNFVLPDCNSAVKNTGKSLIYAKATSDENNLSIKSSPSGNKLYLTPLKLNDKPLLTKQVADDGDFEIHNHSLCEQEEKSYVNDYFTEFKFSDQQIKDLVQSVKISVIPVSVKLYEPCDDIVIIEDEKSGEKSFSLTDIFSDIVVPQVPPPEMVL